MSRKILTVGLQEETSNGSDLFVSPSHAVSTATSTATYNMSTTTSSGNATDKVKYDYIYDYTVPTVTEAAAFCNAFTVTGANPYNAGANALQTAVFADSTGAVKTLLVNALGAAAAAAEQPEEVGAELTSSVAIGELIDATLTKRLNKVISLILDDDFDRLYYGQAVVAIPGAPAVQEDGKDIDVAIDSGSGAAALTKDTAADAAVADDGPLNGDATTLALQIPGTNMALYASATGAVPTALLLKGGDKVVLGFSVTLASTAVNSNNAVAGFNSTPVVADSHPNTLTASEVTLTHDDVRSISIAVRLTMPVGDKANGGFEGIRAPASV